MELSMRLMIAGVWMGLYCLVACGGEDATTQKEIANQKESSQASTKPIVGTQALDNAQVKLTAEQVEQRKNHLVQAGFTVDAKGALIREGVTLKELTNCLHFGVADLSPIPSCPPNARMYNALTPYGTVLLTFRGKGSDKEDAAVADAMVNITTSATSTNVPKKTLEQAGSTQVRKPQEKPSAHE